MQFINDEMESSYEICDMCESVAGHVCGVCNFAVYCSKKCQRQDWDEHKEMCTIDCGYHSYVSSDDDDDDEEEKIGVPTLGMGRKKKGWVRAKPTAAQKKARRRKFRDMFSKKKEGGGRRLKRFKKKKKGTSPGRGKGPLPGRGPLPGKGPMGRGKGSGKGKAGALGAVGGGAAALTLGT